MRRDFIALLGGRPRRGRFRRVHSRANEWRRVGVLFNLARERSDGAGPRRGIRPGTASNGLARTAVMCGSNTRWAAADPGNYPASTRWN